jgi:hypothetical protein
MSEVDDLRTASDELNLDFDEDSNEEPNENSIMNESENTSSVDGSRSRNADLQLPQNVSENLDKRGRRQVLPDASLTITLGGYSFEAYVDPVWTWVPTFECPIYLKGCAF